MQLPLSNCSHILLWYFPHLGYSISKYSTEQGVRGSGQPVTVTLSALPDEPLALLGGTQCCLLAMPLKRHWGDASSALIFTRLVTV